jgi:transposase
MRRIRDVLRLKFEAKLSDRALAAAVGISKGSVAAHVSRARAAGLSWPLPTEMDDTALERELRRRAVTRALLWREYRIEHPGGFGYSWFCEAYYAWKSQVSPTMRQSHAGGEKVFVDFAGDTIVVVEPGSGEIWQGKLFVACMGASSLVFAEARSSEGLADWLGAHLNLFAALGGVPRFVVWDNLQAAVTPAPPTGAVCWTSLGAGRLRGGGAVTILATPATGAQQQRWSVELSAKVNPMSLILIIVLLLLLGGGGGFYGYRSGYYGGRGFGGILGLLVLVLILYMVFGGGGGMYRGI